MSAKYIIKIGNIKNTAFGKRMFSTQGHFIEGLWKMAVGQLPISKFLPHYKEEHTNTTSR